MRWNLLRSRESGADAADPQGLIALRFLMFVTARDLPAPFCFASHALGICSEQVMLDAALATTIG